MECRFNLGGGGNVEDFIKGIYEEYKVASGGSVEAGDFVKLLNKSTGLNVIETDKKMHSIEHANGNISAVALSDSKVFIAHGGDYSSGTNEKYLYGTICTISKTGVVTSQATLLNNELWNGVMTSVVKLSESKVFVAHNSHTSFGNYLYGMVCTISGTSIITGTNTQLSSIEGTGNTISAVALNENKVFIAHSCKSNTIYKLYGMVCTISGTSITKGTDTSLSTTNSGNKISAVALNENKVFIAHDNVYNGTSYCLYGVVCIVIGTNIAKGTDSQLSTYTYSGYAISAVALNENKILVANTLDNSTFKLSATIFSISETTIAKKGSTTILSSVNNSGKEISIVALSNNMVFIAHRSDDTNKYLNGLICEISENDITVKEDKTLSTIADAIKGTLSVALSINKIFVVYTNKNNAYLNCTLLENLIDIFIKTIVSSTEKIDGIAITSGQAGEMITTVRPNVN